jgi:hypothetical protein
VAKSANLVVKKKISFDAADVCANSIWRIFEENEATIFFEFTGTK